MKAIQITRNGGPEVLDYGDTEEPVASENKVVIRLKAIGVNYIDTYQRSGLYKVPLPYVPGLEGAGEIASCGSAVRSLRVGDRVAFCGVPGSYAELVAVPADRVVKLPEEVSFETAAALMLQGMTAHYLARSTYPLSAKDTCLVHAGAGGVGLLLIQLAKLAGSRVITTVSSEEKAELATQAGADDVILYTRSDFEKETRARVPGGVQVVYDSVGKDTFSKSLGCLARRGYLVLFGQSSGVVPPFDPTVLNEKGSLFLTRPKLGDYIPDEASLNERSREIFSLVSEGNLRVRIGERFPLGDAAEAHRSLEGRKTTGKVLLTV
ncbi:MAG: quinone oxidoreductase [Bdellovibrionota bacterium]